MPGSMLGLICDIDGVFADLAFIKSYGLLLKETAQQSMDAVHAEIFKHKEAWLTFPASKRMEMIAEVEGRVIQEYEQKFKDLLMNGDLSKSSGDQGEDSTEPQVPLTQYLREMLLVEPYNQYERRFVLSGSNRQVILMEEQNGLKRSGGMAVHTPYSPEFLEAIALLISDPPAEVWPYLGDCVEENKGVFQAAKQLGQLKLKAFMASPYQDLKNIEDSSVLEAFCAKKPPIVETEGYIKSGMALFHNADYSEAKKAPACAHSFPFSRATKMHIYLKNIHEVFAKLQKEDPDATIDFMVLDDEEYFLTNAIACIEKNPELLPVGVTISFVHCTPDERYLCAEPLEGIGACLNSEQVQKLVQSLKDGVRSEEVVSAFEGVTKVAAPRPKMG